MKYLQSTGLEDDYDENTDFGNKTSKKYVMTTMVLITCQGR
jgi:hypothetical protein